MSVRRHINNVHNLDGSYSVTAHKKRNDVQNNINMNYDQFCLFPGFSLLPDIKHLPRGYD